MRRYLDDVAEPPDIEDFGFWHHDDDVFEVCSMLLLSNYHILPGGGGWEDQEETWGDDIFTWLHLHDRLAWERRQDKDGGDVLRSFLDEAGGAPDVSSLFHD